jgi:hypothetical protein
MAWRVGLPGSRELARSGMGKLYEYCQRVQQHIESNGLDIYKSRGEVAMRCGFLIPLVKPDDPDDPAKIQALREAAKELFGLTLD